MYYVRRERRERRERRKEKRGGESKKEKGREREEGPVPVQPYTTSAITGQSVHFYVYVRVHVLKQGREH